MKFTEAQAKHRIQKIEDAIYTLDKTTKSDYVISSGYLFNGMAVDEMIMVADHSDSTVKRAVHDAIWNYFDNFDQNATPAQVRHAIHHSGYSAFGMSHIFDYVIDAIDHANAKKMKVFMKLGK